MWFDILMNYEHHSRFFLARISIIVGKEGSFFIKSFCLVVWPRFRVAELRSLRNGTCLSGRLRNEAVDMLMLLEMSLEASSVFLAYS